MRTRIARKLNQINSLPASDRHCRKAQAAELNSKLEPIECEVECHARFTRKSDAVQTTGERAIATGIGARRPRIAAPAYPEPQRLVLRR